MDPGTDARDVLEGISVKLKHGWIGVVNRGQADINSRVSLLALKPFASDFLAFTFAIVYLAARTDISSASKVLHACIVCKLLRQI